MNPTVTDYANYLSDAIGSTGNSRFKISAKFEVEAKASTDVEKLFRSYINEYTNQHIDFASEHIRKVTPTVDDYKDYIVNHAFSSMEPHAREKCGRDYVADANRTQKPTECFEQFIETYGNESPLDASQNVRNTKSVCFNQELGFIANKISDGVKSFKMPEISKRTPLEKISDWRDKVAANIKKMSVTVNGREFTQQAREVALKGIGRPQQDSLKKQYSEDSFGGETSFQGKKVSLELVIVR